MSDLINGREMLKRYQEDLCYGIACKECSMCTEDGGCRVEEWIDKFPSADRPQGEWVLISEVASNLGHKCSKCGEKAEKIVTRSVLVDNYYCNKAEPITEYTHEEQLSKFCPNCGADMRKGADDVLEGDR